MVDFYARTLRIVLGFPFLTMVVFLATIAVTVLLYSKARRAISRRTTPGFIFGRRVPPPTSRSRRC